MAGYLFECRERMVVNILSAATFVLIIFGWILLCFGFSYVGGWHRLSTQYRTNLRPAGKKHSFVSGSVGLVGYRLCLKTVVGQDGIFLEVALPFRPWHPPLFIPWGSISSKEVKKVVGFETAEFSVGDPPIASVQLPNKIFQGA